MVERRIPRGIESPPLAGTGLILDMHVATDGLVFPCSACASLSYTSTTQWRAGIDFLDWFRSERQASFESWGRRSQ